MPLECRLKTRRGEHLHNISRHVIQAVRHGPLPVLRHSSRRYCRSGAMGRRLLTVRMISSSVA
jgi:hypothetical protein